MTETNNQSVIIPDLTTPNAEEIKGGPTPKSKRIILLQSSATGQSGLADLEPNDDVTGGKKSSAVVSLGKLGRVETQGDPIPGGATLDGCGLNHNETVASDDETDETAQSLIADLEPSNTEQIKGGPTPKSRPVIVLQSSVIEGDDD